ncbi:MAG: phosphoglycerate dehydrogenase [Planctomycetota bacterium]
MSLIAQVTTYPFGVHSPDPLDLLAQAGIEVRLSPHGRKHTTEETTALLGDVDILIAGTEPLPGSALSAGLPRLKQVARVGVGLDHFDVAWCARNGIAVTYTPDAPARSVVEEVFALLIGISRRLIEAHEGLRRGEWLRLTGPLWQGRTLGIVGCGRIGKQVAVLARAYGMRVLAHDIVFDQPWARAQGVEYVGLHDLLERSHAVSLHVPSTPATFRMIDAARLARMRPGSYLINTCRGDVIDEAALHAALASNHLAGAALDVYDREPYTGPLRDLPNIFLCCHQGSCSFEGRHAMEFGAAENAVAVLQGRPVAPERVVWLPGMPLPGSPTDAA